MPVEGEVRRSSREAIWRVISHSSETSSRLIWIYAIAIGAFQGSFSVLALFLNARFQVTEQTIGYFFMYIGSISVFTRVYCSDGWLTGLGKQSSHASDSCSRSRRSWECRYREICGCSGSQLL